MENRYLFKAKRKDNGEWVQGYLYGIWEKRYILWGMTNDIPDMIEVDPSTICQCTGLKDKNSKLIWEMIYWMVSHIRICQMVHIIIMLRFVGVVMFLLLVFTLKNIRNQKLVEFLPE